MALQTISGGGVFSRQNISDINSNFSQLVANFTPGNLIYCDPASSNTATQDGSQERPYTSLVTAFGAARNGKNDVILLVGNGAASGSARLSDTLAWNKDAVHLCGVSSGVNISNRSRIAPTSGVTAFANFFTLSGNGCCFNNIQWFDGFSTGTTSQIAITITGGRNLFQNCHIAGMGDAASAADAGSRSLKITTTGENMFVDTVIGLDTATRSAANASVEFASAVARNQFIRCVFPFQTSAATPLGYIGSAAGCLDRFQIFDSCLFINNVQSTSTTISGLGTLPASAGGLLVFKNCTLVGITEFGTDATTRGQCYVDGAAPTAATSGIAVNPT